MSEDFAVLHERLLAVERQARVVTESATAAHEFEVPMAVGFALVALRDAIVALDAERDRLRAGAA